MVVALIASSWLVACLDTGRASPAVSLATVPAPTCKVLVIPHWQGRWYSFCGKSYQSRLYCSDDWAHDAVQRRGRTFQKTILVCVVVYYERRSDRIHSSPLCG